MQNEDTIIMIKNALLSGDAVASEVLSCLNSLIVSDADPIVGRGDAIEAYSVLRDSRARLPRDESGKRVLSGDAGDKLRERLARVLFHIPLDNLRRRETRVLERDPAASAAPDEERPSLASPPRRRAADRRPLCPCIPSSVTSDRTNALSTATWATEPRSGP